MSRWSTKRIAVLLIGAVLFGVFPFNMAQGVFADGNWYLSSNFDNLSLTNDGSTAGSTTYTATAGSMWLSWAVKQPISSVAAPSGKRAGSSLSSGTDDKALKVEIQSGSSSNSYFNASIPSGANLYGNIRFSVNVYVESFAGGSHAPIQVDFRNNPSTVGNLVAFRSSGKIQTYPGNTATDLVSYSKNKWYYLVFDIDTVNKKYTLSIDGVIQEADKNLANQTLCFPGDPSATSSNIVKEIRFSVNNGKNSTGSVVYVDDIYLGVPPVDNIKKFEVIDSYFTSDQESQTPLTNIVETQTELCANVTVRAEPSMESSRDFTAIVAMYQGNNLKKVWKQAFNIPVPTQTTEQTVKFPIALSGDIKGAVFKIFVWDNLDDLTPLIGGHQINVVGDGYI